MSVLAEDRDLAGWTTKDPLRASVVARHVDRLRGACEQLDTVGFSQYPYGSAPDDPFVGVLSGANLEFIHHMAEIALLRDLWRARSTTASQS